MKNIIYKTIISDIKTTELKLKRIKLNKEHLLGNKPFRLRYKKLKNWESKLEKLIKEEELTHIQLQELYTELSKFL